MTSRSSASASTRRPPPPGPVKVARSAAAADHRDRLVSLRDRLTAELENAPPAYVAALARQLQAVLAELAGMPDHTAPPSKLDEIRAARTERLSHPEGRGGAPG